MPHNGRVAAWKPEAGRLFSQWRDAGEPMRVSAEKAFELTDGAVEIEDEINLSTLAVKYAVIKTKQKRAERQAKREAKK